MKTRLPGLDTLRTCAILAVMSYHFQSELPPFAQQVARFGWVGVDLFFALSGFLIASQFFRSYLQGTTPSLGRFYRQRAFRILPAYSLVLLLYWFVPVWREAPGMSPRWEFLTFTENLFVDYSKNHAFSHVWSLCVEEHFYLLFPVTAYLILHKPAMWKPVTLVLGLVLAGMGVRGYILLHILRPIGPENEAFGLAYIEKIYYPTYSRLDGLLAGVSLAMLRTFRPLWWSALERRGHALAISGLLLAATAAWSLAERGNSVSGVAAFGTVFGYPLLALGLALLVASAVSVNGFLSLHAVPGARIFATLAFSLYLTHKEVVHLVQRYVPAIVDRPLLALPTYAACCLAVAALLYGCVERPFLLLRDQVSFEKGGLPIDLQARIDPAI